MRLADEILRRLINTLLFFKKKTAYDIKECDWSSEVCSSDLALLLASVALVGNNKKNLIISSSLADVAQLAEQLHGKE